MIKQKQNKSKCRCGFKSLKKGFETQFQRVQTKKSEEGDSNPYGVDSNPNSNKST